MISFLHPAMLWALPLALLPWWVRPRRRPGEPDTRPFAATQFLAVAVAQAARAARRRDRLLTALRIAILVLLILLFARPVLAPHRPTTPVIATPSTEFLHAAGIRTQDGRPALVFAGSPLPLRERVRVRGAVEESASSGSAKNAPLTLAPGTSYHPALLGLDLDFRHVRVWRYTDLEVPTGAVVILRLSNRAPFLVEHDGWIRCAVPADLSGSDLPLHPGFVPLVRQLMQYLERYTAPAAVDPGRALAGLVCLLILIELFWAGWNLWKLVVVAGLALLALHPAWTVATRGEPVVLIDRTPSMQAHEPTLAAALTQTPAGERVDLTGPRTNLGDALLALTNRSSSAVFLYTDGQHNQGLDPAWAARALRVPVFPVRLEFPTAHLEGERVSAVGLAKADPREPLPTSVPLIRVLLTPAAPTWEYRHVRHALARDPGIQLVTNPAPADVTLVLTNQTWRLRRHGNDVFERFWSSYVRARYSESHPPPPPTDAAIELATVGRDDAMLTNIAIASGGQVIAPSQAGETAARSRRHQLLDLRDSWIVLLALIGLALFAWRRRPDRADGLP